MRRIPVMLTFLCCLVATCGCSDKKDVGYYFDQGKEYFKKRNYPSAIESFERVLEIYPGYQEAYYEIGELYFRMQEPSQAIPYFKEAIELDSNSLMAYNLLADCLMSVGKFEEAEQVHKKQLKIANGFIAMGKTGLAYIYGIQGDYNKAIEATKESFKISPTKIDYYNLGDFYFQIKDYQQVIDSLVYMKGLEDMFPDIHYMRAISFLNLKKKDQAIEEYEKLKQFDPSLAEKLHLEISQYN